MKTPGSSFLHERNPNFHATQEVENVVNYLRAGGEAIPNEPADKITAYLAFLANKEYVNDGILTGDRDSIDRQIDAKVIDAKDVPEGYFELQRRIAREQGCGDVRITPQMRRQMIEAVQADQRASLGKWVKYLGGDDGGYPDWFKIYTWTSVTKLGAYDKDKREFQKRSRGTTAPYPELNREALAYVYDVLNKSRVQGEQMNGGENDAHLQKLLESGNFGKLYAHAVMKVTSDTPELRQDIRGSWTKFNQTNDPLTARQLSDSLQGHGTGWCTAGESTANMQLQRGDFYVYYTRDKDGKETVPRVAIRMENGEVAEVRGVNPEQELEPIMFDIVTEKLENLPGGDVYIRRAENMKRLTAIEKLITANPAAYLSKNDLRFLYELDEPIICFGENLRDPRIDEILEARDFDQDFRTITGMAPNSKAAKLLLESNKLYLLIKYIDRFYDVDASVINSLLSNSRAISVINEVYDYEYYYQSTISTFISLCLPIISGELNNESIRILLEDLIVTKEGSERFLKHIHIEDLERFLKHIDKVPENERERFNDVVLASASLKTYQIADMLPKLRYIGPNIARALLSAGEDDALLSNLDSFNSDARNVIRRALLEDEDI